MQVELIHVTTSDGIRLDGAYRQSSGSSSCEIDAIITLHGVGGNFYGSQMFDVISTQCDEAGIHVVRINTRGHDSLTVGQTTLGGRYVGAAMEIVGDCVRDIAAWCEFLRTRGCQRIALVGHSLGAIKAVYQQAHEPLESIAAIVAVSPPKLSSTAFLNAGFASDYRQEIQRARELVDEHMGGEMMAITVPFRMFMSAQTYADKYGSEKYNITEFADRLACPALFVYGAKELVKEVTFKGLPERLAELRRDDQQLDVATVDGADHNYRNCEEVLAREITGWFASNFPR